MFNEVSMKGIARYLLDERLDGEPLHLHVSVVAPGDRSHAPHCHGGYEAFYMLEGEGTLEIDDQPVTLHAGDVAVFDPQRLHGLVNTGSVPMRYIVVLRP